MNAGSSLLSERDESICPHCGYDLVEDRPDTYCGVEMAPYGNARVDGREIRLTKSEAAILWAMVKAKGRPLSVHVLAERCGYEGEHIRTIEVFICRLRKKLVPHISILNERGIGFYIASPTWRGT